MLSYAMLYYYNNLFDVTIFDYYNIIINGFYYIN